MSGSAAVERVIIQPEGTRPRPCAKVIVPVEAVKLSFVPLRNDAVESFLSALSMPISISRI